MSLRLLTSLAVAALLTGCTTQPYTAPRISDEMKSHGASAVRSSILDETNHMTAHLDDAREVVYLQSFGNSLAVGLMFGPLGVLANIAATNAVTESDKAKLHGKLPVSASHAFSTAIEEAGLKLSSQRVEGGVNFTPYILLTKTRADEVLFAAAVIVETAKRGNTYAHLRYVYQLPLTYPLAVLEHPTSDMLADMRTQLQHGYLELIRFYQNDRDSTEKTVKYKSGFLSPRMDFYMQGSLIREDDEYVWLRSISGVSAVLRTHISALEIQK